MKNAIFCFIVFISVLIPYSTALKCHYCSGYDYLPANVQTQLNSLNITFDDIDTTPLSGNCKSRDDSCSNATWCTKKTTEYKINFNGIKYVYHTYYKTCENNDTKTEAKNDKCYNSSADAKTMFDGGIKRTATFCYCNDKDYCNNTVKTFVNFAVLILTLIMLN